MSTQTDPIRVGIVGLGTISRFHADRLRGHRATLVGGVDVVEASRDDFAVTYDAPAFASFDDLLAEGVDAVVVSTPNKYHEQYAVAALDAGVDVLCEKPLANTLESAERIAAAARDADAFCMVGFNNRFAPGAEVLRAYLDDGRLGDVTHVEANFIRRRGVPGRGGWFTRKELSGGGALIDIGVHAIDLALYFLDFPEIAEVVGRTRTEFGDRDDYTFLEMYGEDVAEVEFTVDDHATAFVRTTAGQSLALEVAWAANRPPNAELVVEGTEAGATFDRGSNDLTVHEVSDAGASHFSDTVVETRDEDTHEREQAAFLEAVRTGTPPDRNTVEQALTVQRVIDAIYRSDETGRAVQL